MPSIPPFQSGIAVSNQAKQANRLPSDPLPLTVSEQLPMPKLRSKHDVLIRVLAVALNPTDFKMVSNFSKPGDMVGCDFCGIVEDHAFVEGESPPLPPGSRVCGGGFPYNPADPTNGSFARWVVSDSRVVLKVPSDWSDLAGAAMGAVGWGTVGLALWEPRALALPDTPSSPAEKAKPVLVYGGATASGTMACQLLKLAGYSPIAVCSDASADLVKGYGAASTVSYVSSNCVEKIKSAAGQNIKLALDCITSAESVETCMAAIARTGGRYACLDELHPSMKVRKAVQTKAVMGYEGLGIAIDLGDTPYSRPANQEMFEETVKLTCEIQKLIDVGAIRTHPVKEIPGGWDGIIKGLGMLHKGQVRLEKLVVAIPQ